MRDNDKVIDIILTIVTFGLLAYFILSSIGGF